jgi:thioredoxin 1
MEAGQLNEVTEDTFTDEVLRCPLPVLVDFWAPWCAPCRAMTPVLEGLAKTFAGRAFVAKINIDDCAVLPNHYDIRSIPTMFVFKGGKVIFRFVGTSGATEISDVLTGAL